MTGASIETKFDINFVLRDSAKAELDFKKSGFSSERPKDCYIGLGED